VPATTRERRASIRRKPCLSAPFLLAAAAIPEILN